MKRTGSWYKVRVWSKRNACWNQLRGQYSQEDATRIAKVTAEEMGVRVQAIHLKKQTKGAALTVVFDSEEKT